MKPWPHNSTMSAGDKRVLALCVEVCETPVMEFHTNPEAVSKAFKLLANSLHRRMLPVKDCPEPRVPGRYVGVDEFMFMEAIRKPGMLTLKFKHIVTRNYVFVCVNKLGPRFEVPRLYEPFFRGGFGPLPERVQEGELEAVTC